MVRRGGHAVVLGASIGGLLAARVLADYYDRVTVVERDVLPDDPVNHRGVPQGRLIHACLARLIQVLDELFPRMRDDLIAQGATRWEGDFAKLDWSFGGHSMVRSGKLEDAPRSCRRVEPYWNGMCGKEFGLFRRSHSVRITTSSA